MKSSSPPADSTDNPDESGTVISASRRSIRVLTADHRIVKARIAARGRDVTVGDAVTCELQGGHLFVTTIADRKNCLARTYRGNTKEIAVNLDMLFVVTAMQPLFNTAFIDRVTAVCRLQDIPCTIILNKTDLDPGQTRLLIEIYQRLEIPVIRTCATSTAGVSALQERLADLQLRIAALAGVSGVGKSTLLNRLVPDAQRRTAEVSRKTGKGRQTTALAMGYVYDRPADCELLIIDLPGIQNFGVSSLSEREVSAGFAEFEAIRHTCEYLDCLHQAEPSCAVKQAVENGDIALSRYESYLGMVQEIAAARPY